MESLYYLSPVSINSHYIFNHDFFSFDKVFWNVLFEITKQVLQVCLTIMPPPFFLKKKMFINNFRTNIIFLKDPLKFHLYTYITINSKGRESIMMGLIKAFQNCITILADSCLAKFLLLSCVILSHQIGW